MLFCHKASKLVYLSVAFQLIACLSFIYGFFSIEDAPVDEYWSSWFSNHNNSDLDDNQQYDSNTSSSSQQHHQLRNIQRYCDEQAMSKQPLFDKLVFILIDACRADMMPSICNATNLRDQLKCPHSRSMPFIESKLYERDAIGHLCEVNMPTLTMPRIKALMTGSLPAFMDSVLNFNPIVFKGDSLLAAAKQRDKRIVFAGDDTWPDLFPAELFHKIRRSPSFHVTDYKECDDIVTQVGEEEMTLNDWDLLLLHYLGVDHIGHAHERFARMMSDKLKELDGVVGAMFTEIKNRTDNIRYLMVVTADHGMTNEGRHGSNSLQETMVPLVFLDGRSDSSAPSQISDSKVKQIDIVNTLSALLGYDFPSRSKGRLIRATLDMMKMTSAHQSCVYLHNALHMMKFVEEDANKARIYDAELNLIVVQHDAAITNGTLDESVGDIITLYDELILALQNAIAFKAHPPNMLWVSLSNVIAIVSVTLLLLPRVTENLNALHVVFYRPWLFVLVVLVVIPIFLSYTTSFIRAENVYWGKFSL